MGTFHRLRSAVFYQGGLFARSDGLQPTEKEKKKIIILKCTSYFKTISCTLPNQVSFDCFFSLSEVRIGITALNPRCSKDTENGCKSLNLAAVSRFICLRAFGIFLLTQAERLVHKCILAELCEIRTKSAVCIWYASLLVSLLLFLMFCSTYQDFYASVITFSKVTLGKPPSTFPTFPLIFYLCFIPVQHLCSLVPQLFCSLCIYLII